LGKQSYYLGQGWDRAELMLCTITLSGANFQQTPEFLYIFYIYLGQC